MLNDNYDHVSKWVSELQLPDTVAGNPSSSTPESEVNSGSISGTASVHAAEQPLPGPSGMQGGSLFISENVGERPSTSGKTTKPLRRTKELVNDGSELDSDYDDEFDLNEITAAGGTPRGIPDDEELEEPDANLVNSIESAMDEAIDQLIDIPTDFEWQADFDTFRGVPETFSGPAPGSVKDYDMPYDVFH
ncbi:uncharacterized protein [Choristoneura fumiferana]|uniref:uncharacterized protein n=1 Tax=Choristoneura fumiferana TaxID=7141 RepID=UPI003D159384